MAAEDEVLLPPGCRFRVEGVLPQGDLTIIQLLELPSKEWIMDLNPGGGGLGAVPSSPAPLPQGADASVSAAPPPSNAVRMSTSGHGR